MRIAIVAALIMVLPAYAHAAVVINEVAWMGTAVSANAEWIELANTDSAPVDLTGWHVVAESGSPSITLTGSVDAGGYFLLERTSDATVPAVAADQTYTGPLTNAGTTLTLSDAGGSVVDRIIGGANWANIGGDNASKETAQRTASGWETAAATPRAANAGAAADSGASSAATSTAAVSVGGEPEYVPIPALRISTGGSRTVSAVADTAFTAVVYDSRGNRRNDAVVTWSFGDGTRRTGASVFHAYYEPGEYAAIAHAVTPDGGDAFAEDIITAQEAAIRIASVSSRGITLANTGTRALNLSFWRLSAGGQEFKIPEDTQILAGRSVLFPAQVLQLPMGGAAALLYPSGEMAAAYPVVAPPPQPSSGTASYEQVQAVEPPELSGAGPIINTQANIQAYEEAVGAPAAETELAAAGAALPPPESSRIAGIFKSPWILGLLGVIAFAGGAFIFL